MSAIENAIAASSLLLAVLAVLFGVWNAAVDAALARDVSGNPLTLQPERREILSALLTKALPLAVGAWATAWVFFHRSHLIADETLSCAKTTGCQVDDVSAAFLLTEVFVILIAVVMSFQFGRLVLRYIEAWRKKP